MIGQPFSTNHTGVDNAVGTRVAHFGWWVGLTVPTPSLKGFGFDPQMSATSAALMEASGFTDVRRFDSQRLPNDQTAGHKVKQRATKSASM